jgi:hypothetical protein
MTEMPITMVGGTTRQGVLNRTPTGFRLGVTCRMPRTKRVPPIVAAVVQPVAKRLSRMEALLIEMRHEQDVKLKHITRLQEQVHTLTEQVQVINTSIRRISPRRK